MKKTAKSSIEELYKYRKTIDLIDTQILNLLNKRADSAIKIANIKRKSNLKFHSPEREKEIINRIIRLNKGKFPNDAIKSVFREIISASLFLEYPLKIVYLGPEGTFTHLAATRHFGSFAKYIPVESVKAVFNFVECKEADYGLVPIENSSEGVVSYTLDMFMDYDLKIFSEVMLKISHNLLSKDGDIKKIKKIYSHPQASAQCRGWLESNLPNVPIVTTISTAKAAKMVSTDEGGAAIASELSARLYDLKFIKKHIEDKKNNFTRFLIISKEYSSLTGDDKTSIMFSIKDKPGALYEVLYHFKEAKINLTRIQSRPSKRKAWEYVFFVDMEGHIEDKHIKEAIEKVRQNCLYLTNLGSYPIDKN